MNQTDNQKQKDFLTCLIRLLLSYLDFHQQQQFCHHENQSYRRKVESIGLSCFERYQPDTKTNPTDNAWLSNLVNIR